MAKTTTSFKIDKDDFEALKAQAEKEGITQSAWLRSAVELKLEEQHESLEDLQERIQFLESELSKVKTALIDATQFGGKAGQNLEDTEPVLDVGDGEIRYERTENRTDEDFPE